MRGLLLQEAIDPNRGAAVVPAGVQANEGSSMSPNKPPADELVEHGVTRRTAVRSAAGAAATLLIGIGCGRPVSAQSNVFTPEMFGARGDGRSDDYAALQKMAAAVTAAGGGVVRFGRRRHYLIDRVVIWGGPNKADLP